MNNEGSVIRSSLFLCGQIVATLIFAPLGIMTFPFSFARRYAFLTQWARFNLWWLKTTCRLDWRVEGLENIPQGNAIILCKHQSAFETMALQRIFPPQVWLLKRELLWIPFFGWGLAMLEPIAIDRKAGRESLNKLVAEGVKRLTAGRWVVIFPEGTRVAPGEEKRYALGGASLAERSGYPVVPVAHNAGEYWPKRGFVKRSGTIRIAIGPIIDSRGRNAAEINALAREWIEAKVHEISTLPGTDASR